MSNKVFLPKSIINIMVIVANQDSDNIEIKASTSTCQDFLNSPINKNTLPPLMTKIGKSFFFFKKKILINDKVEPGYVDINNNLVRLV